MSRRLVRIHPLGGPSNQMFQLMFAEAVRLAVGEVAITGHDLPDWDLRGADVPDRRAAVSIECRAHAIPFTALADFLRAAPDAEVHLRSVALRHAYHRAHRAHFAALFHRRTEGQPIGAREIAISIRLGDILLDPHSEYIPMPLGWYEQLIDETGLSPVFVGQIGEDRYSAALRRRFAGARFLATSRPMVDFATLRGARHVALSISTFAWLATWLSEAAEAIHLPIAGLFHPGARPDIDLLPLGDARYRFHQSGLLHWDGTEAELDGLIAGSDPFTPVSHEDVAARYAPLVGAEWVDLADLPVGLGPGGLRARDRQRNAKRPSPRAVLGALRRRLAATARSPE